MGWFAKGSPATAASPKSTSTPEVTIDDELQRAYDAGWRRERLNWITATGVNVTLLTFVASWRLGRPVLLLPLPLMWVGVLYEADTVIGLRHMRIQRQLKCLLKLPETATLTFPDSLLQNESVLNDYAPIPSLLREDAARQQKGPAK